MLVSEARNYLFPREYPQVLRRLWPDVIRAFVLDCTVVSSDREDDEMPGQQLRHLPLDAKSLTRLGRFPSFPGFSAALLDVTIPP